VLPVVHGERLGKRGPTGQSVKKNDFKKEILVLSLRELMEERERQKATKSSSASSILVKNSKPSM
jgi:hypothetical protein